MSRLLPLMLAVLAAAPAWPQDRDALAELDRAGRTLAAASCPRPVEVKVSRVGDDEMRSVDCKAWRVASTRPAGGAAELPMALVLLDPSTALPGGLAVGAASAEVRQRLGPPSRQAGDSLRYLLDPSRPAGDSITFEVDAGRVKAISWSWRVD